MKTIIPCYCCGNPCYKHEDFHTSVCQKCSFEIYPKDASSDAFDHSDPMDGNGFPYDEWHYELDLLKQKKMRMAPATTPTNSKVYTDMCPCGIHPQQCEYHRS